MDVQFGEDGIKPFEGLSRDRKIADAAGELGVAPGVAVLLHQLHRKRLLDYRAGNRSCVDLAGTFTA